MSAPIGNAVPYADLRSELRLGDLVLFSGNDWASLAIKVGSRSPWSHVGMVVVHVVGDTVLLWEATTKAKLGGSPGVRLTLLSERIRQYEGEIAVRRVRGDEIDLREWAAVRRELGGRPYERSTLELVRAAYDGPGGENVPDLSSLFCSELVAETYARFGRLRMPLARGANEWIPHDFAAEEIPDLSSRLKISSLIPVVP